MFFIVRLTYLIVWSGKCPSVDSYVSTMVQFVTGYRSKMFNSPWEALIGRFIRLHEEYKNISDLKKAMRQTYTENLGTFGKELISSDKFCADTFVPIEHKFMIASHAA